MKTNYDVIVIGGGPGGSSIATLLQRKGWDVVLFEKAKFPRYHIGESLVPGCVPKMLLSTFFVTTLLVEEINF
ncbi:tryptophan 7-halogenase [Streptococcus thermophilus]|uniref:NAD(P)/FAD-dependent oxidoreductase n=1 Tax=Streptococcus thermophilus TaxID=1308 RepID=UPI001C647E2E|nr:FAD-dependent oxidoreductase [Streptococcus thermophilus]MBW7823020.1 tryptophan 7-halogenase [Streptococcus thermophilus]